MIDARTSRRNIGLFFICQALFVIGTSTMIAEAALVGNMLADDKALATLPVAVQQLFTQAGLQRAQAARQHRRVALQGAPGRGEGAQRMQGQQGGLFIGVLGVEGVHARHMPSGALRGPAPGRPGCGPAPGRHGRRRPRSRPRW